MRDQRQCLDKLRQTEVRSEVKNVKFYLCSMDGRLDTRTEKFCNFDLQSGLRTPARPFTKAIMELDR